VQAVEVKLRCPGRERRDIAAVRAVLDERRDYDFRRGAGRAGGSHEPALIMPGLSQGIDLGRLALTWLVVALVGGFAWV
jgi:hypothetical protein